MLHYKAVHTLLEISVELQKLSSFYRYYNANLFHIKSRIFLLIDLREIFSDLGSGDEKNK